MDLAAAEQAALRDGQRIAQEGRDLADVGEPRDPAQRGERIVRCQYAALRLFSQKHCCLLSPSDLPLINFGKGGMEHFIYHHFEQARFWKTTFPNFAGFGPSGYPTPADYLRRLRLANTIFGDDIRFEGVLEQPEGYSLVTSQPFIQPHPERFIPTECELTDFLQSLGFHQQGSNRWFREEDGIILEDCHDRNFIRTPDESIVAIDAQPLLKERRSLLEVIPWPQQP